MYEQKLNNKNNILDKKNIFIIFLFSITVIGLNWGHLLKSDEGVFLNAAWNIYNGKEIYVDFLEFIAPASVYFILIPFKMGFVSYLAVKIFSIVLQLLATFYFFKLSKFWVNRNTSIAISFLYIITTSLSLPLINHNIYSTFIAIIAFYYFCLAFKKYQQKFALLAGLLSGLTFLFLQSKGIVLIVTLLFYLVLNNRKLIISYLLGSTLIVSSATLVWGPMALIANFSITSKYLETNTYRWWPLISSTKNTIVNEVSVWPALILFLAILVIWYLFRKNRILGSTTLLFFIQLAFFASILNHAEIQHILANIWPFLIILAIVYNKNKNKINHIAGVVLMQKSAVIFLVLILIFKFGMFYNSHKQTKIFFDDLRTRVAEDKILAIPYLSGIYFELGKINPYKSGVVEILTADRSFIVDDFATIKQENPIYVLTNYDIAIQNGYKKNIIDDYIENNYSKIKRYPNSLVLWKLN